MNLYELSKRENLTGDVTMDEKVKVSKEDLLLDDMIRDVVSPEDGAVVSFLGRVRNHNNGSVVRKIELQRYEDMTFQQLERVRDEALNNFEITDVCIRHRYGELLVGDRIVGIVVSASHRQEAFDACRYCIDRLKEIVPLWKKETTGSDETRWL